MAHSVRYGWEAVHKMTFHEARLSLQLLAEQRSGNAVRMSNALAQFERQQEDAAAGAMADAVRMADGSS